MVSSYRVAPNADKWSPPPPPPPPPPTPSFDSLTIPTSGSSSQSIFLAQYSPAGRVYWVARVEGVNVSNFISATDADGNFYFPISWTSATAVVYNSTGSVAATLSGTANGVLKFDKLGVYQWFLSTPSFTVRSISIAPNQEFIIAGVYNTATIAVRNLDFSIYSTLTRINTRDGLIVRYSSAGVVQWVARTTATSSYGGGSGINSLICDASSVIVCGGAGGAFTAYNSDGTTGTTMTLDPTTQSGWVAKYNSAGVVQWGVKGTTGGVAYSLASRDASGAVYVTCLANNNPIFYNTNGSVFRSLTIGTRYVAILMQYTSAGVGSYLVQAAGSLTNPSIQSMTADADGNVLYGITAGGSANNFITFTNDNGSTVAGPTNASYYYALAKVSTTGSVSWVNNVFTNTAGQHTPLSAGSDGSGGFYQSGQIQPGTSTFTNAGGGVGATLGGTTKFGGTLAKYDTGGNVLWAARQNQAGGNMSLGSLVVAADRITALGTYVGTIGATIYSAGL